MTNYEKIKSFTVEEMAEEIKTIANWDRKEKAKAEKDENFYINWLNKDYEDGSADFPYSTMPVPAKL